MPDIQMVDLKKQYQHIKDDVDKAIQEVIDSTAFINGHPVKAFAAELEHYLDARYVIPCANGTDALQAALMALELEPGDEVITTPFTFVATAEMIALLKLKPVFADIDPDTFNIDPVSVEKKLTARTKCILPVHLFGQAADMNLLIALAKSRHIAVVEDNAQAIGATYQLSSGERRKTGTLGDMGCTSFFPSKNLGAYGDAGAITTNDPELAKKLQMIVNHGTKEKYYHHAIGINSRLDTLQAAILRIKLKHLDDYNRTRREAADQYDALLEGLDGITTPARAEGRSHVFHQYTLKVHQGRDKLRNHLQQHDIPHAVYYPLPLHLQPAYQAYGYRKGDFPVSETCAEQVLSLPMHTELTEKQQTLITDTLKAWYK